MNTASTVFFLVGGFAFALFVRDVLSRVRGLQVHGVPDGSSYFKVMLRPDWSDVMAAACIPLGVLMLDSFGAIDAISAHKSSAAPILVLWLILSLGIFVWILMITRLGAAVFLRARESESPRVQWRLTSLDSTVSFAACSSQ